MFGTSKIHPKIILQNIFICACLFILPDLVPVSGQGENGVNSEAVVKETLNQDSNLYFKSDRIRKIVIDAGHGGKDHGCSGFRSKEKDLTLSIARKLGKKINQYHPEIEVVFTREHDVFIPLFRRIDMANKSQADLFISIHCNAVNHGPTQGTETYIMGLHTAEENLLVAKRENASILYEKDFQQNYDGYSPHSPEGHIILSMFQNAHLEQSLEFASMVENSFQIRTPLKSRGVKQAGFVVLRHATMPSVLIETGFLTNRNDESYLISGDGQDEIAHAIALAFTEYRRNYEGTEIANVDHREIVDISKLRLDSKVVFSGFDFKESRLTISKDKPDKVSEKREMDDAIIYRVQIAASRNKPLPENNPDIFEIPDLEIRFEENMYKYLTGHFTSLERAARERSKMRSNGFNGAFIVAYRGEKRVKP